MDPIIFIGLSNEPNLGLQQSVLFSLCYVGSSTSTHKSPRKGTSQTQSRSQQRQSQGDNEEEINEGPLGRNEAEAGFIAKATDVSTGKFFLQNS
jgi:hypothetical protein